MRIIALDDESGPLNLMRIMLEKIEGAELVASFSHPAEALEYLRYVPVDLAFVDIEMPGMDGLEFTRALEGLPHPPQVVFVTAYSQYAVDAWKTNATDYILKPFDVPQLKRAIDRAAGRMRSEHRDFEIRCFPCFDVLVDGEPLVFHSKRAKELLAYLVHHRGSWVSVGTLVYDLFGDVDERASKSHYRVILSRLRQDLAQAGMTDIIKTGYGKIRVDIRTEYCDYYRYLRGHNSLFNGEYLQEYSWAEIEAARMRTKDRVSRRQNDE